MSSGIMAFYLNKLFIKENVDIGMKDISKNVGIAAAAVLTVAVAGCATQLEKVVVSSKVEACNFWSWVLACDFLFFIKNY